MISAATHSSSRSKPGAARGARALVFDEDDSSAGVRPFLLEDTDQHWDQAVGRLRATGNALSVQAARGFPAAPRTRRFLVGLADPSGDPVWGAIAEVAPSRVVPWRTVGRVLRFGQRLPVQLADAAVAAVMALAHRVAALRLHVEVFVPDAFERERLVARLRVHGFQPSTPSRLYERSILIDLRTSDEQELLTSFHATCRRHIRAFGKHGLVCRSLNDLALAARLRSLTVETLTRTGGVAEEIDWRATIRFTQEEPTRATLLGVFRQDRTGDEALIGYVLGYRHDDVLEYSHAASARLRDLRAPLLYAPTWELMRWGRANGASWFDFGGVGAVRAGGSDPTAGISNFKRYFKASAIPVGAEMVYAPHAGLDAAARLASTSYRSLREIA